MLPTICQNPRAKWSKYPKHKSEVESHLKIDSSKICDTQTWIPKHSCDQVLASSKCQLHVIIHPMYLCIYLKNMPLKVCKSGIGNMVKE